ncbi:hypothetical protein J6590_016261 [Homalodisca vitripennis]|nr:hypothetical protein J6590_016261 [Homalodisca vitripennis]
MISVAVLGSKNARGYRQSYQLAASRLGSDTHSISATRMGSLRLSRRERDERYCVQSSDLLTRAPISYYIAYWSHFFKVQGRKLSEEVILATRGEFLVRLRFIKSTIF